ncbi:MAG: 2,4-dihydroxyhept-2-ene-1,7-dioic acid aldolase [Anaerolineae bacterium SM23_ 63]|nr:MAG: 2,4-dihydroxyhept-2-ene-1,7-dioic acid aldolase [Anaerolineae bacterium SM23_ 63]
MPEAEKSKEITLGSWLSLGSPYVTEIMLKAGFDWLVIDMEHSAANTLSRAQQLIQIIDLGGCIPLVRIPINDSTIIKQVMDAGAHGVIVPMVNTRKDAEEAVAAVRYPPRGKRGVGLWRAQGYGRTFEEYRSWLEQHCTVIVQIEHIHGVRNLKEILDVDGVDGFIIGPYDLSASLGVPGELQKPVVVEALQEVEAVATTSEKWAGFHIVHPDHDQLKRTIERGYDFIAYGVDFTFLTHIVDHEIGFVKDAIGSSRWSGISLAKKE